MTDKIENLDIKHLLNKIYLRDKTQRTLENIFNLMKIKIHPNKFGYSPKAMHIEKFIAVVYI